MTSVHNAPAPKQVDAKHVGALMAALMAAIFAFQLNASMLSPVLTTMRVELNTTDAEIGLTQTVFFTACAVFSLFLPRLGDLKGRKKVLIGMLACTAIGCVISACATNVTMLMIGRVIQGVAGPVVPMTLLMLHAEVTDNARYARLMAILTSVNGGIARIMLDELRDSLREKGYTFTYDDALVEHLVKSSYSAAYGARNLRRCIQKELEDPMAVQIIDSFEHPITQLRATAEDGKVRLDTL